MTEWVNERCAYKKKEKKKPCTTHNVKVIRVFAGLKRNHKRVKRENVINLLDTISSFSAFWSFTFSPIMQFLMHLTFITATFHYDYMEKHKEGDKIPFCAARESSHILLAPINLLKTSEKSRKINKQKKRYEMRERKRKTLRQERRKKSLFALYAVYFDTEIKSN